MHRLLVIIFLFVHAKPPNGFAFTKKHLITAAKQSNRSTLPPRLTIDLTPAYNIQSQKQDDGNLSNSSLRTI